MIEERGAARATDPKTSHDAAESLNPTRLYGLVADTLRKARTGLITHEVAHRTGISWGTITPRMAPMEKKKIVFRTNLVRAWYGSPGNPPSDRMNTVWQLTDLRDVPIPLTGGTMVRKPRQPKKAKATQ